MRQCLWEGSKGDEVIVVVVVMVVVEGRFKGEINSGN